MLKRWLKNIHWLLNHPPTNITTEQRVLYCDYCEQKGCEANRIWNVIGHFRVCNKCLKKALDKVLKGENQ